MPKKKTEEQKINDEIARLYAKKNDLEIEEAARVQIPFLQSLVGKSFVYRNNSYSCPEKKSDYWDVYKKVLECDYGGKDNIQFIVEEFSTDKYGKIQLEVRVEHPYTNRAWWKKVPFSGYVEYDAVEYEKKRADLFREMVTLDRCRMEAKRLNEN